MKPALTRLELAAVAIVFAIGVWLRAAWPERMAVEHFDEGVYASNLYSSLTENRYPDQHLYAPPLLPALLEWAAIFGGPQGVMWVNVVAGSVTLLVVWGMVRAWWGPAAAIGALTLLAFDEFHIAYSRAALTDALLCLWLTAGVWAGWRAVLVGGSINVLGAGVLAGLAWWTKYNGWLTLAITGAGTAGWVLWGRLASGRRGPADAPNTAKGSDGPSMPSGGLRPPLADPVGRSTKVGPGSLGVGRGSPDPALNATEGLPSADAPSSIHLLRWAATALVAFLVWSPWLWQLQQYGGYAAVAKNHAGYFAGLGAWVPNATQQLAAQAHYFGAMTTRSLVDAFVYVICFSAMARYWSASRLAETHRDRQARELACWMMMAWTLGLSVAVPLYRPYPRLALPWVVAVATAAAVLAGRIFAFRRAAAGPEFEESTIAGGSAERPRLVGAAGVPGWLVGLAMVAIVGGAVLWLAGLPSWRSPAWQDRSSLRTVAAGTVARLQEERLDRAFDGYRCAVYVLAEPGLFFHLAAAEPGSPVDHLTQAASDYGMAEPGGHRSAIPAYLLVGPHSDQAEADRLVAAGRLTQLAEFDYHPSDLVLLDEYRAWQLKALPQPVTQPIRLFHVKTD